MTFISPAYAEDNSKDTLDITVTDEPVVTETATVADAQLPPKAKTIDMIIPLVVIFVIFYFLLIRPQQKRLKAHEKMIGDLKRGQKVVTSGGILGTIVKCDKDSKIIDVEIANDTVIQVYKHMVSEIVDPQNKPGAKSAKK